MINLIIGTMFAGKSTELLKYLRRAQIAGRKTCLLRPKLDTRIFLTHDDQPLFQDIPIFQISEESAGLLNKSEILSFDTIGIDEWQFFPMQHWDDILLPFLKTIQNEEKECYISGLSGTFHLTPFEIISHTIPLANHIQLESAICLHCGENAYYTYRQHDNIQSSTDDIHDADNIGAEEKYAALCWHCRQEIYSGKKDKNQKC